LRAIPSKLGGVLALLIRILIILKWLFSFKNFFFKKKRIFFLLILFILTFLGGKPVEIPYLLISQIITVIYFLIILLYIYIYIYIFI
jgi:ubiquinol-cytochrome c reductase cytochrome b subunit